ncbi:MAG: tetratricopeptide repeat protein [Nitrospirae bacterium]|nr:tetratricopeptide repeat protein [Nitrospirota bacterium]
MNSTSTNSKTLFFKGNSCMAAGDDDGAESCFREALRLSPDFAEAYANLAFLLAKKGVPEEAERCYGRSIALNASCPQTYLNFGAFLAKQKRFEEADAAYSLAIMLNPQSPAAWSNRGVLYACMKREKEAEEFYRMALNLDNGYSEARFNLSYILLRQGRFEEGWYCLEARNWYGVQKGHLECPRWQGEVLTGKSLLIVIEKGHGDMIHFCRYAAVLKAQGVSQITLICHPALKTLFATLEGVDTVISYDEKVRVLGWDYWTPPLSIPYYCKTRIDSIPATLPYLKALPEQIAKWEPMLPGDGIRVGLVWKGNPKFENDADRSIPGLSLLAPLWAVANVHFISLQKGAGEDEAEHPPAGLSLIHLGSRIKDFADAAAIVASLDLVICVDTAVAHLTGALGKPCWVLLPGYMTDWRWLTGRNDSPWYPGVMRLFRQREVGNWTAVIAEVGVALERFMQEQRLKRPPLSSDRGTIS